MGSKLQISVIKEKYDAFGGLKMRLYRAQLPARSSVLKCLGVTLTILFAPMEAFALVCSEWVDQVRTSPTVSRYSGIGVERLTSPVNINVEYHDLYCAQFGDNPGFSSLEAAKEVRENTTYMVLHEEESGRNLGTYGDIRNDPVLKIDYFDETTIPKTPLDFPYFGILYGRYGGSSHYQEYHIYSIEPNLKPIAVIQSPISGEDFPKIKGFYIKDQQFLIDTITTKGTPAASINSQQKFNIESFAFVDGNLVSVYLGQSEDEGFDFIRWLYSTAYKMMD